MFSQAILVSGSDDLAGPDIAIFLIVLVIGPLGYGFHHTRPAQILGPTVRPSIIRGSLFCTYYLHLCLFILQYYSNASHISWLPSF